MKYLFLVLISLFLSLNAHEKIEDQCKLKILNPALKERCTEKMRLDNGLEIYLISDPQCHKAGAGMAVNAGSFNDPDDRPGMAHYVEHMLFMGNEKYPDEEEYHRFLISHGGERNAFTTDDRTVYIFTIDPPFFEEGLDRFAQFFHKPLFRSSSMEREVMAVDQEFRKDVPLNTWRTIQIKKEICNKEHPFHRFSIGNKSTLGKMSSDEIRAWYEKHYSSDRMHLVIYSPESLDKMRELAIAKFASVEKRDMNAKETLCPLFNDKEQNLYVICPMQEERTLELSFEIFNGKKEHFDELLGYVICHEAEGTLTDVLKKKGWIEKVACSTDRVGPNHHVLSFTFHLTEQGVKEHEAIAVAFFDAIASLKISGIPEYIYNDVVEMTRINFAYQERSNLFHFLSEYAYHMVEEPLATFPEQSELPVAFDGKGLVQFIEKLTPSKCTFFLTAPPKTKQGRFYP